ncbi:hypothetical protein [Paenibacillus sp. FSL R7-277]|uniref:hypothetical protein n=1 Tax=Paenibacillus sp. FSL R7-277 TaxID=1227352 RepID=UPI0004AECAD3|nr:hypothetical protein [Paenibacillus sp. FSL R7-277]
MNKTLFILFVVVLSLLAANHPKSFSPTDDDDYTDTDIIDTFIYKSESSDN